MTRFKPGTSGNPKGRPRGSRNPSTRLRELIASDVPLILSVLRDAALGGDVQAANALLSRALPALRPEAVSVEVIATGESLCERAEAVASAALAGEIPVDAATSLMQALATQAKVLETHELLQRIERLENALAATKENQSC